MKSNRKIPQTYKAERDGVTLKHVLKRPDTDWHTSGVSGILDNREYTGRAILNRKTSKSYKDHHKFVKPEDEWIVHENAHPAIIDDETFEIVRRIRAGRRRIHKKFGKGVLDDVMHCRDCGARFYRKNSTRYNSDGTFREYCYYNCQNSSTYSGRPTCTQHSILMQSAEAIVLGDLQRVIAQAKTDEQ